MLRPFVICIAGFDPSGGAGILADVKCFEQHGVYGFGVCSAMTVQTDTDCFACEWRSSEQIIAELVPLLDKFEITVCKIGLIQNTEVLLEVIQYLKYRRPEIKIVLDPVLKASSGFDFQHPVNGMDQLIPVLQQLSLICPNYTELDRMGTADNRPEDTARQWAAYCPVLLKGGHNAAEPGTDYLYTGAGIHQLKPGTAHVFEKHGSGCVLSSAITARLALGYSLEEACRLSKQYIEHFLNSNPTLLGYHSL